MQLIDPSGESYFGIPGYWMGYGILLISILTFCHILYRRYLLIATGQPDPRWDRIGKRLKDLFVYGIMQRRQPRYLIAGLIHITIFWGFVVLSVRSVYLIGEGLGIHFLYSFMQSGAGAVYNTMKDIFELAVLIACLWACYTRFIERPKRYEGSNQAEAYIVLGIICLLMITDMLYEGSALLLFGSKHPPAGWLPAARLGANVIAEADTASLKSIYLGSFWLHYITLFFFLNFLPVGKHFHIITSLPNVFFRKEKKGSLKPACYGVTNLEELETCGVGKFEGFTWKQILDFFSCTECGRCTDNCPANAAGRPLSPKMLTLKLRNYGYEKRPLFGRKMENKDEILMVGNIVGAEELWSCTTCGACEEECPVFIEYIDKIVDMRRHLIETSQNPPGFNKVLINFETTGNPFGKPREKRVEWLKDLEDVPVRILEEGDSTDVLLYVDSYGSYDPKSQAVTAAIAYGMHMAKVDFGILGVRETDTGHQVRRIGEEGLFQFLMEQNVETLNSITFKRLVTVDPHALNTLKNDYSGNLTVQHYTEYFGELIQAGKLKLKSGQSRREDIYTYHDPCYLGRHNGIYNAPRELLSSIPGLKLVEMEKNRNRSFCCGGGDVILWHEIEKEKQRPGEIRVLMAKEAGANIMVTACPFCFIHFEDAIKTLGLEDEMKVTDLMALLVGSYASA